MTPGTPRVPAINAVIGLTGTWMPNLAAKTLKNHKRTPPNIPFKTSLTRILSGTNKMKAMMNNNIRPSK